MIVWICNQGQMHMDVRQKKLIISNGMNNLFSILNAIIQQQNK